jgi:hypothetical protein
MAKPKQQPIEQQQCTCGTIISMVPMVNSTMLLPVEFGKHADGDLVIIVQRGIYMVRLVRSYETDSIDPDRRRIGHWNRCPMYQIWSPIRRALGVETNVYKRSGPCVHCRKQHAWHYGGPKASPLCDTCRSTRGMEVLGEPEMRA